MLSVLVRLDVGLPTPPAKISPIMNTKKSRFLSAVRIIAPNDPFILNLAQCVPDDELPDFPGAAALDFVTSISRMVDASPFASRRTLPDVARKPLPCSFPRRRASAGVSIAVRHLCHAK